MSEEQELLNRIKALMPPDEPHVGYSDQIRWEILIKLLDSWLAKYETLEAASQVQQADPESYPQARKATTGLQ